MNVAGTGRGGAGAPPGGGGPPHHMRFQRGEYVTVDGTHH